MNNRYPLPDIVLQWLGIQYCNASPPSIEEPQYHIEHIRSIAESIPFRDVPTR